jgi:hypothetical protein
MNYTQQLSHQTKNPRRLIMDNNSFLQPNQKRVLYSVAFAFAAITVLLMQYLPSAFIPMPETFVVLNQILSILATPMGILPAFASNGEYVEFWAGGFLLKTPLAVVCFWMYYFVFAYLCLYRVGRKKMSIR